MQSSSSDQRTVSHIAPKLCETTRNCLQPLQASRVLSQRLAQIRCLTICLALVTMVLCGISGSAAAEEPYERFLKKLKEERQFDVALTYLDMLQRGSVDANFRSVVELERGLLTYHSAAQLPLASASRAPMLDNAERHLRSFLEQQKQHRRRGDARLKLGELLLARADEAKLVAGETAEDIPKAIQFYTEAHELYESTIVELMEIHKGLRGARVDAKDTKLLAYRKQLQQNIRSAQLFSGKAIEFRAGSRAAEGKQRAADLSLAMEMYNNLYTKAAGELAIKNYALLYRSKLQIELGKSADAIDGLQRIADLEGVDVLRPLQIEAVTALVDVLAAEKKYQLALERGSRWVAGLRPDERKTQAAVVLKLAVAQLQYTWSEALKVENPNDRAAAKLVRDARGEVRGLMRIAGTHQDEARELLSKMGIDPKSREKTELPEVKTFDEALAAATDRLNAARTQSVDLETLNSQVAQSAGDPEALATLKQQLQEVESQIDSDQSQALELLRTGLAMAGPDGDRDSLFDARFKLAILLLRQQQPWEAIAVGSFLTHKNPSSERGLNAAALTLAAYSDLLTTASPDEQIALGGMLEPLTLFLLDSWPDSPEAAAATAATVQLALVRKDWDKAERLLSEMPADAPAVMGTRRDVGMAHYSQYVGAKRQSESDPAVLQQSREQTLAQLEVFWPTVSQENLDARAVEAANAMARVYLDSGEIASAKEVLLGTKVPFLSVLLATPDRFPARVSLESLRLAIQLTGGLMASGELDSADASSKIQSYITAMESAAEKEPGGAAILASVFAGLAQDLNGQLTAAKSAADRKRLFELLTLVATQTAKSEAFNVRYWAADTLVMNAKAFEEKAANRSLARDGYVAAEKILSSILQKEAAEPGWIDPAGQQLRINLLLARCRRGAEDYAGAIGILATVLKENSLLLDAQIEAAETLEAWAKLKPKFHKTALAGGGPGSPQLFWGWGKIAGQTQGKKKYEKQFFRARYGLALNRFRYAVSTDDDKLLAKAERDITMTAGIYPELGGAEQKREFDQLLAAIRKKIGK